MYPSFGDEPLDDGDVRFDQALRARRGVKRRQYVVSVPLRSRPSIQP